LGLYDLSPGSGKYIITSPLFSKVTIQRDNGNYIAINAHNNNFQNKYIQSMQIDGVSNNDVNVDQNILLNGNHTISYTMSDHDTG
jgi:putative alpha-1,2-mannosidase